MGFEAAPGVSARYEVHPEIELALAALLPVEECDPIAGGWAGELSQPATADIQSRRLQVVYGADRRPETLKLWAGETSYGINALTGAINYSSPIQGEVEWGSGHHAHAHGAFTIRYLLLTMWGATAQNDER